MKPAYAHRPSILWNLSQVPTLKVLPFSKCSKELDYRGQEFQYFHLKEYLTMTLKGTTAKWQQMYAMPQTILGI